jgi:hypothetical protein
MLSNSLETDKRADKPLRDRLPSYASRGSDRTADREAEG